MFYFVFTTFTVLLIVTQHALEQQKGVHSFIHSNLNQYEDNYIDPLITITSYTLLKDL